MKPRREPAHRPATVLPACFDPLLLVRSDEGRYLPATADQILNAARHAIERKVQRGAAFDSPEAIKDYLRAKLGGFEHEVFSALFLDTRLRLIEYVEMFRGTINQAHVYPREVVKEALRLNTAAVIFSHNHPSGVPEPTRADEALTHQLRIALALIDVRVLDHIIVAGPLTCSFAEHGLL
jgi:DNA repair protein RadC